MDSEQKLHCIWAKSAAEGAEGETLTAHTYRVVSALAQLAERYPSLAERVGEPELWHRAFWSCWLHDLGKIAQGFQLSLRGGKRWSYRHEVLSLAFLSCFCRQDCEDFSWIAAGIGSHHKDASLILNERYNPRFPPADWRRDELAAEIEEWTWLTVQDWTVAAASPQFRELGLETFGVRNLCCLSQTAQPKEKINGFLTAGLNSYLRFWKEIKRLSAEHPRNQAAIALRGIIVQSDHLASAHAPDLDNPVLPKHEQIFSTLGLNGQGLFSHQNRAGSVRGSVVFSAPTGSGKTEAALLWARKQQESDQIPRTLVFVLPYQASLNAMWDRLRKFLDRDVALIHGKSLQALYRLLMDPSYDAKDASRLAREQNNFGRLNKPGIRVSTPYQLLKAAFRLKGYESVWASLADSMVVLDEIHAYEPERLGLLFEFLSELVSRWNVKVCAMSATMPSWLKKELIETLSADEIPPDPELFQEFARHRIEILKGNLTCRRVHEIALREHAAGRSVLVAANTIGTAQRTYDALRQNLSDETCVLLHGRFAVGDRLKKEKLLLEHLSKNSKVACPMIAVATQVVEVSLNLDFDTIISEPAPLEALVQRFGRVNRNRSKGIVPVRVLTESLNDTKVYDPELTKRSLSILRENNGQILDECKVSGWLDRVYAGELERQSLERIRWNRQEFRETCLSSLRAFETDDKLEDVFDSLFQGTEVLPLCKVEEYCQLREESTLKAGELLVPISWERIQRHRGKVIWDENLKVRTANFPYDSKYGLKVEA